MSRRALLRRRGATAVAGALVALAGTIAAATLLGGFASAARVPEPVIPKLTFNQAVTPVADVTVGSTITYTASIRNTGKVVTGMSVADTLPDGVVLIAAEADGTTCSGSMPRITCTWTSVATGTTVTASFVVQVVAAGQLVNGMQLTPADSGTTAVTAGPVPAPLEAGEQAAPIVFTARTITLAGK